MNENIDLTKILKDCPRGTAFYSTIWGKMFFELIIHHPDENFPVRLKNNYKEWISLTKEGKYSQRYEDSECILFPSKDQRDWSKFSATWYKKEKFDPKTLNPFDKVLARRGNENYNVWFPDFISDPPNSTNNKTLCMCVMEDIAMVIPYNDETKHLIGTTDEAPEYYRYWE